MENSLQISNTENKVKDSDFEFGCLTPDSPSQDSYINNSPADRLFSNGRLLPHSFPQTQSNKVSKDQYHSLMSSRSNSTNSRSSCSSSNSTIRTSSSSSSLSSSTNKLFLYNGKVVSKSNISNTTNRATKLVTAQLYGSYPHRWQHITPVPGSIRRNNSVNSDVMRSKKKEQNQNVNIGPCMRFVGAIWMACKTCHAIEPSREQGDRIKM